jgi:hypothetical protein
VIGPWLETIPDRTGIDALLRRNNIPPYLRLELEQYVQWIPCIDAPRKWEAMLTRFMEAIYGSGTFSLVHGGLLLPQFEAIYSLREETALSKHYIEERYEIENAMLLAVSEGDAERALQCLSHFRGHRGEQRTTDTLRNRKNLLIVLNSLARKAAENGCVHPAHIHAVSDDFARRIEAFSTLEEFGRFSEVMLRRYCELVNQFSLRGYSPVIRKVLNFVDFNPREPLSLNYLAEKFYINPNHLSRLFRKKRALRLPTTSPPSAWNTLSPFCADPTCISRK